MNINNTISTIATIFAATFAMAAGPTTQWQDIPPTNTVLQVGKEVGLAPMSNEVVVAGGSWTLTPNTWTPDGSGMTFHFTTVDYGDSLAIHVEEEDMTSQAKAYDQDTTTLVLTDSDTGWGVGFDFTATKGLQTNYYPVVYQDKINAITNQVSTIQDELQGIQDELQGKADNNMVELQLKTKAQGDWKVYSNDVEITSQVVQPTRVHLGTIYGEDSQSIGARYCWSIYLDQEGERHVSTPAKEYLYSEQLSPEDSDLRIDSEDDPEGVHYWAERIGIQYYQLGPNKEQNQNKGKPLSTTNLVSTTQHGLMSADDKKTLDDLASEKKIAMFIIEVNAKATNAGTITDMPFLGFELKGSVNNFTGGSDAEKLIFYSQSQCADTGSGDTVDKMKLYVCTHQGNMDFRSYQRMLNTGADKFTGSNNKPIRLTKVVVLVDTSCLKRNPSGTWLSDQNDELIWAYAKTASNDVEQEEAGIGVLSNVGNLWRPIMPVKWFRTMPSWANQ